MHEKQQREREKFKEKNIQKDTLCKRENEKQSNKGNKLEVRIVWGEKERECVRDGGKRETVRERESIKEGELKFQKLRKGERF